MSTLLQTALGEIQTLNPGEEFLVKDLFKGYEWKRFDLNEPQNLGRLFCEPTQNPYLQNGDIILLDKNMPINKSTERNSM